MSGTEGASNDSQQDPECFVSGVWTNRNIDHGAWTSNLTVNGGELRRFKIDTCRS